MFERIKKLFTATDAPSSTPATVAAEVLRLKGWAKEQGLDLKLEDAAPGKRHAALYSLQGLVEAKTWRMEGGPPLRDFVHGGELRFRSELGILSSVSVVVMNRTLKNALEKRAFKLYTDSLQTTLDPKLPEEMRWLAMFPKVNLSAYKPLRAKLLVLDQKLGLGPAPDMLAINLSTNGSKLMSTNRTLSCASLMIHAICCGNSRGFTV